MIREIKQQLKIQHLRMQAVLKNLFYLAVSLHILSACSLFQTTSPDAGMTALQGQRASSAMLDLQELEDIDTLIMLDNQWLASHFKTVLEAQSALGDTFRFRKIDHTFNKQIIAIKAIVDISDDFGNTISATLFGDILLKYRGNGLEWRPRFNLLQINSKDFVFNDGVYAEPVPELTQNTLQQANTELAQAVVESGRNTIPLNPSPLGEIQVGASLPGITESVAQNTQSLRGVFMLAGSAVLIETSTTSIVLDLSFIPDLSTCPADVSVSRAEFTSAIESREPVGIARSMNDAADVRYFFSEISGAKRPLTIIHYWFADGLPLAVEELPVDPSERWRTWSSKGTIDSNPEQWEVLVVEKETGCILASKSIRKLQAETPVTIIDGPQPGHAYLEYKDEFTRRASGFSIVQDEPGIALIEVRRSFLQNVLQASLAGLSMGAEFDGSSMDALQFSAQLQPFESGEIVCEHRSCVPAPACKANLTQCKRIRDTRDCSSCQFRNPLNNRCVSEAVDPLCEAERGRQNARYEAERTACIRRAEDAKHECERLNAQALKSCQIESGFKDSACESIKTGLNTLDDGTVMAQISARSRPRGKLNAIFSNFLIEGNLERLKLDLGVKSSIQLDCELEFTPLNLAQPLSGCISAWSGQFKNRFTNTPAVNSLLSNFEIDNNRLTANWSGFGVTFETLPSPLESIFVETPQLLANCKIGLTVSKVEQAIAGDHATFFRGQTDLLIQPQPTKILLAPATINLGKTVYSADAQLSIQSVRYDIRE
mgnify:CR=1 FL=1